MRLINFLSITEARPKNISSYEAAVMIAKDDDLFDTVSEYVGNIDIWDDYPRELAKFIAILNLIKPYNQRLYRGERGYFENRDGTTHYYETNYPFTSWSLNTDTAKDFADHPGTVISYTDGPIKAVSLSDIATARMRMFQGESHYSGMQAEHFVLEPVPRANIWDLAESYRKQMGKTFPETNGQNVTGNKLVESMNFDPTSEKPHKEHGTIWSSVFPDEWTSEHDKENMDWDRFYNDFDYEAPENPKFRPDLNLNLANANMAYIMRDILGFDDEDHGYHVPIDMFLTKAQIWLQKQLGQTTPELPSHEEPREFKRQVTTDPDTGMSTIGGGHVGPRMVQGGRREGYDNETIMRMVKIANLGKEMGATHVSAF